MRADLGSYVSAAVVEFSEKKPISIHLLKDSSFYEANEIV